MRIIVVGLGSMGRRRIKLLKKIDSSMKIMGVDNAIERCITVEKELNIPTQKDLDSALLEYKPDIAVISTSPISHSSIINKCLKCGCHVFTELNLIDDGYDENIALAQNKNRVLFLSSTFLYRDEITYIRNEVSNRRGYVNYTYHVGQYLPDWHPWEKVENYFVSDIRTNGCRELMAIELPWIVKTFGKVKNVIGKANKKTKLNIKYNDNFVILLEHENGTFGSLAIDVVSRKPVRNLEIYGENIYLSWNGTPNSLKQYDYEAKQDRNIILYENINKDNNYASFIIENAYENELKTFLDEIMNKNNALYTFQDDKEIIELINKIECDITNMSEKG